MVESNKKGIGLLNRDFCKQLKVPIRDEHKKNIPFGTL